LLPASLSCSYAVMDPSNALSDDDYDVISNPSQGSLDCSFDEYTLGSIHELPAFEEAKDRFETTRWTASDIQAYIHKGLNLTNPAPKKLVRIYVDGSFDMFDVGHVLQLRQAKLAFSFVHLIVGVFSDEVLLQNGYTFNWPEIERLEFVRHCRWVNEVTKDAPWELTLQFIQGKGIDYVAVDEGSSVDPNYDRTRVRGYDELKRHGMVIKTRRTHALNSQRRLSSLAFSPRETPTSPATPTPETHDCKTHTMKG